MLVKNNKDEISKIDNAQRYSNQRQPLTCAPIQQMHSKEVAL